jgi:hypothetical protein
LYVVAFMAFSVVATWHCCWLDYTSVAFLLFKYDIEHRGAHWHWRESFLSLCLQAHGQRPRAAAFHAGRFTSFQLSVSFPAFSVDSTIGACIYILHAVSISFVVVGITTSAAAATLLPSAHSHTCLAARQRSMPSILLHRSTTAISKI